MVSGLNDDSWHNVSVTVDLLTALLTVDVTSASNRERRLMTLMTSEITSSPDESWNPVTSFISLGGLLHVDLFLYLSSVVDVFIKRCAVFNHFFSCNL